MHIMEKKFKLKGVDIRTVCSGSTGATNVKRGLGTKWFIGVMLIDAIKGFIVTSLFMACPFA